MVEQLFRSAKCPGKLNQIYRNLQQNQRFRRYQIDYLKLSSRNSTGQTKTTDIWIELPDTKILSLTQFNLIRFNI